MFNLTNLSFAPDGRLEARPPSNPYHSPLVHLEYDFTLPKKVTFSEFIAAQ